MDLVKLQAFFFWCMIINTAVYAVTAIVVISMKDLICSVHKRMFNMEKEDAIKSMQNYLAKFKLLITVFNFTPWIALLIIK